MERDKQRAPSWSTVCLDIWAWASDSWELRMRAALCWSDGKAGGSGEKELCSNLQVAPSPTPSQPSGRDGICAPQGC